MLLIRRPGGAWHAPTITAYPNEEALKQLLAQSPGLIPGEHGGQLAVATEVYLPITGYIDLLAVDPAGNITVVECKLENNAEIRRKVVGQIFAYAAGLWKMPYEAFDQAFTAKKGVSLAHAVAALDPEEWDEESFRATVAENLARGRFRLIIAVDRITDELRQIVLYLNQHTVADLQLLALELGYIADEGVEILLPQTYGEESAQEKALSTMGAQPWKELTMFQELDMHCSPPVARAMRELYDFALQRGAAPRFQKSNLPSVALCLPLQGRKISTFNLSEQPSGKGRLAINFGSLANGGVAPTALARLADRLSGLPGIDLQGLKNAEFKGKYPGIPLDEALTRPGAQETVKAALDELLQGMRDQPSE